MTKWMEFLANDAYIFFDFFFFTNFPQCVIVASSKVILNNWECRGRVVIKVDSWVKVKFKIVQHMSTQTCSNTCSSS